MQAIISNRKQINKYKKYPMAKHEENYVPQEIKERKCGLRNHKFMGFISSSIVS